jgi:hypothetical protein
VLAAKDLWETIAPYRYAHRSACTETVLCRTSVLVKKDGGEMNAHSQFVLKIATTLAFAQRLTHVPV